MDRSRADGGGATKLGTVAAIGPTPTRGSFLSPATYKLAV